MDSPPIDTFGIRQQFLLTALLENKNGLTADELAEQLGITRSAVHQHLSALQQGGYVDREVRAPQGGRPGFGWRLTDRGLHLFPKHYALFSDLLIGSIKDRRGSEELTETLRALGQTLARQFAHRLAGKTPAETIEEVAAIMRELGYQSHSAADPGHELPLIDARNCIYHHLARAHREVCELDLALIGTLLGADIEHVECMVRGGDACRFRVRDRSNKSRG